MKKHLPTLFFAHIGVVSALALATLIVLDDINPRIGFMRRSFSLPLSIVLIVSVISLGVSDIAKYVANNGDIDNSNA